MKMIFLMALLSLSVATVAKEGRDFLDKSCMSCHGDEMFNREGSKIKTTFDLRRQVSYCRNHLNIDWFPEDEQTVVKYLNENFYHLKD
jgi:hypothetical protein